MITMKRFILIPLVFITIFLVSGCEKWLDVSSKTDVVENDMLSDEQGFMEAMAGVYYTMADNKLYGDQLTMSFLDVIAHRYNLGWPYYNPAFGTGLGQPGYYDQPEMKDRIEGIWAKGYYAIANVNNIIAHVDAKKDVFKGNNYQLLKGEALGIRAFLHFDLLRMFGPSYLAAPDATSIPYVTTFTGKVTTPLSTVKAVTDSVIADLNAAAVLLKDDNIAGTSKESSWLSNRKSHFNNLAVEATLARVYLYRGDKVNALLHANKVINAGKLSFVTAASLNKPPFDFSFTKEQVFALAKYDLEIIYTKYFTESGGNNELSNDSGKATNSEGSVERIYETSTGGSTDYRYLYMWLQYNTKYYFQRYKQSYALEPNLVPLIRLPEMYYIAAECSDAATATTLLNVVRQNRGLSNLRPDLTNDEVQNEIFKEYQKEFYCEGQLFYYYKRLNKPEMMEYDNQRQVPVSGSDYVFPLPEKEVAVGGR